VDKLYFADRRSKKTNARCVEAIAVDVDQKTLKSLKYLPENSRLCFPPLDPLHSGADANLLDIGEIAAKVQSLEQGENDAVVICAGLGGNLSEAIPPMIEAFRKSIIEPLFGLFTLPCVNEGEKKSARAADDIEILYPMLDGIILFDNETWYHKIKIKLNAREQKGGFLPRFGSRQKTPEQETLEVYNQLNDAIVRRVILILRAGEFTPEGRFDHAEVVLDSGEVLNTMKGMGFITIGYAVEHLPKNFLAFFSRRKADSELFSDEHHAKASRIVDLAKEAIYHEISTPCDMTSAQKALVLIAGPSRELSMKGFSIVRKWIDRSIAGIEMRSGDYPVANTSIVAIIIMLSGLRNIPRLEELKEIRRQYKEEYAQDVTLEHEVLARREREAMIAVPPKLGQASRAEKSLAVTDLYRDTVPASHGWEEADRGIIPKTVSTRMIEKPGGSDSTRDIRSANATEKPPAHMPGEPSLGGKTSESHDIPAGRRPGDDSTGPGISLSSREPEKFRQEEIDSVIRDKEAAEYPEPPTLEKTGTIREKTGMRKEEVLKPDRALPQESSGPVPPSEKTLPRKLHHRIITSAKDKPAITGKEPVLKLEKSREQTDSQPPSSSIVRHESRLNHRGNLKEVSEKGGRPGELLPVRIKSEPIRPPAVQGSIFRTEGKSQTLRGTAGSAEKKPAEPKSTASVQVEHAGAKSPEIARDSQGARRGSFPDQNKLRDSLIKRPSLISTGQTPIRSKPSSDSGTEKEERMSEQSPGLPGLRAVSPASGIKEVKKVLTDVNRNAFITPSGGIEGRDSRPDRQPIQRFPDSRPGKELRSRTLPSRETKNTPRADNGEMYTQTPKRKEKPEKTDSGPE
jgi:cell division GTPase FtsZ